MKVEEALPRLVEIVGKEKASDEKEVMAAHFSPPLPDIPLLVITPGSVEEVVETVRFCNSEKVPIYTNTDTLHPMPPPSSSGVVMDFKDLDTVERVDNKNLMAHIYRGVTFKQLMDETGKEGTKAALPAAARTDYPACHYMNRGVTRAATRYFELTLSNLMIVLADGRIHKTGSHTLSEKIADFRDEAGPHLSKWYHASNDIFGIMVRASVNIYPVLERREFRLYGLTDSKEVIESLKEVSRKELCQECLAMNRRYLEWLIKGEKGGFPWLVAVGFESFPEHVDFQVKMANEIMEKYNAETIPEPSPALLDTLEEPWYAPNPESLYFFTLFKNFGELEEITSRTLLDEKYPSDEVGRLLIATGNGRSLYCQYDFLSSREKADGLGERLSLNLLKKNAFFDRPTGNLAREVYRQMGYYPEFMMRIKGMMDPNNILNPGQTV